MAASESTSLERRVARLENEVGRLRGALVALFVAAAAFVASLVLPRGLVTATSILGAAAMIFAIAEIAALLWRFQRPVADVLRARKFEAVDADGRVLVEIGETANGRAAVATRGDRTTLEADTTQRSSTSGEPDVLSSIVRSEGARVELSYRGDGLYEARVVGKATADEADAPKQVWGARRTRLRR